MGWPWKPWFASWRMGSGRGGSLPSLRGKPAPLSLWRRLQIKVEAWPVSAARATTYLLARGASEKRSRVDYILLRTTWILKASQQNYKASVKSRNCWLRERSRYCLFTVNTGVNADTRPDTYSIFLKIFRVFWIASRPTWVTCQYWLSGSKVQVSF